MTIHRDLDVWKRGLDLVEMVCRDTSRMPSGEMYGLVGQLRRAAVSVPTNIAEGAARQSTKEFVRFLNIALGSVAEVDTLIEVSGRVGYTIDPATVTTLQEIRRKLINPIRSLRTRLSDVALAPAASTRE